MVWFGGAVDDGDDQGSGTRQFQGNMFKGLSRGDGDGGCIESFLEDGSNATTPAVWAWFVHVGVASGCALI